MDDVSRYYRILGLEPGASQQQIKQAYRDLVRVWHPDRFSHDERLQLIAQEKLKEINSAYEILIANADDGAVTSASDLSPKSEAAPSEQQDTPTPPGGNLAFRRILTFTVVIALILAGLFFSKKENGKNRPVTIKSQSQPVAVNPDVAPIKVSTPAEVRTPRNNANILVDKTMVAWVTVANLTQRAGTVISICDNDLHYDSIDLGQIAPLKWDAGSDWWHRGSYLHDFPDETADPNTLIQLAVTYRDREITLYREGKVLLQYTNGSPPQIFEPRSIVMFGMRDPREHERFAGSIQEARIYDFAMTPEQITALKINEASDPAPWAWWNFADNTPRDRMGRFEATRFADGAEVKNGRLMLDGIRGTLYVARTAEELEAAVPTPVAGHCALSLNCQIPGLYGNSNYAEIATTGSLTGTFTVECWALAKQITPGQAVIGTRRPKEFGFDLKLNPDKIHVDIGNGSDWLTTKVDAPAKILNDRWHHIACVVTPTRCGIYVNGILCGYKEYPRGNPVLYDADHLLRVGSIDGQSEFLVGHISELRIWQTARTQPEIRANMNRKLTGNEPGLRAYWRFDEGAGTLATDRTGHGLNGTLIADTEWTTNVPPLPAPEK